VEFNVTVIDENISPSLSATSLPPLATLSDCIRPTSLYCIRKFTWTPSLNQGDVDVCFTATDGTPQGDYLGQYCILLRSRAARVNFQTNSASELSSPGWFGLGWFGLVWFGLVWFGLVWFGLVWFGEEHVHSFRSLILDIIAMHLYSLFVDLFALSFIRSFYDSQPRFGWKIEEFLCA
jgi:hypothetical protein